MKRRVQILCVAAAFSALAFLTGCETKSADEVTITVTPSEVQLRQGESQEFTASGAASYRWNLSSTSYGVLSANTGESVVYTSVADVSTNVILSVQGSLTTSSGSTTTNQAAGASVLEGLASIMHVAEQTAGLNASPRSATLAEGEAQAFTATGGTGSYEWSLSDADLGWLTRTSGSVTTYTSTDTNDTQFLTLTSGEDTLSIPIYGE